jgi:hypothetical protein
MEVKKIPNARCCICHKEFYCWFGCGQGMLCGNPECEKKYKELLEKK